VRQQSGAVMMAFFDGDGGAVTSPAPLEGARRGEARPKFEEGTWRGGSQHGKGRRQLLHTILAWWWGLRLPSWTVGSGGEKGRVGGARAVPIQEERERAKEGATSPLLKQRGEMGAGSGTRKGEEGGVWYGERHATRRWGGSWHDSRPTVARG
jgi:hypothetical protein